jgi:hypothetical protein
LIVNKLKLMNYNVFIAGTIMKINILNIDKSTLEHIIECYSEGLEYFTISGKKYYLHRVNNVQIFENSKNFSEDEINNIARKNSCYFNDMMGKYIPVNFLPYFGENVTKDFLGNTSYGSRKSEIKVVQKIENFYVNPKRIEELKKCNSTLDLSKLIKMCEELNYNFANQNYFSVAMISRAIIDHIPPIFGLKSFGEVASNIGSTSVKKNFSHLNNSMRSISDGILHSHIRKRESLPNATQVNFSQDLDLLLGEIVSFLSAK